MGTHDGHVPCLRLGNGKRKTVLYPTADLQTGIDESALAKFYNGQRGLSMEALNALAEFLELKVILGRKPVKKGK